MRTVPLARASCLACALVVGACHVDPPAAAQRDAPASPATPLTVASSAVDVAPTPATAPAPVASTVPAYSDPTSGLPTAAPRAPSVPPGSDEVTLDAISSDIGDVSAFLVAHHLPPDGLNCVLGCSALAFKAPVPELVRASTVVDDDGGGGEELVIFSAQDRALRKVFDAIVSVNTDPDGMGASGAPGAGLGLALFVRAGQDLVLVADREACSRVKGTRKYAARAAAMCRSAGRYAWQAGRFVRVAPR